MEEKEYGLELVNENAKRLSVLAKSITNGANKHDTVKPLELMRFLVKLLSFKGSVVLDSYMGSGTTALACILEDRRFIGMEMNQDYFYISKVKIHTVFFNEVFSKKQRLPKADLLWHLEGLHEIEAIATQTKVSKETILIIKKMISKVKNKLG